MANVDTGLGWSANQDYLVFNAPYNMGQIGIIGGQYYPGQPLPKNCPNADAVIAAGFVALVYTSGSYTYTQYLGVVGDDDILCFINQWPSTSVNRAVYLISPNSNPGANAVMRVDVRSDGNIFSGTTPTRWFSSSYMGNIYYYGTASSATTIVGANITYRGVSEFIGLDAALAAIEVTGNNFYKLNPGYAVASFVRWKSTDEVTYWTPILISTSLSATALSTDGETELPGSVLYTTRYHGATFYMRYYRGVAGNVTDTTVQTIDVSSVVQSAAQIFKGIAGPSYANILVTETFDPYDPFGNTEEGGGEPDPNPQDDDIEEEDLPTLSFSSAGFARIYRPSLQQINDLADYMWTDQTFLQTVINHLKQLLENPMDAVISLSLIPCVPPVGADVPVKVMYVNTGVSMPPVTNQFVQVDCGNFALKEMYGSALDYNPYTKVQLYLPYVGTVKLDTDEVMGKTLQVKYNIDVVTGVCCAYVIAGGDVLYQFSGHCSINQPISSADFSAYINAAIAAAKVSIAAATGGAAAAAGAAASGAQAPPSPATPSSAGQAASETPTFQSTALAVHGKSGPLSLYSQMPAPTPNKTQASFAELAKPGNINTVASVMGGKLDVMHSGGFGGNSGYLAAVRRPYLIVTRPRIANPQQYGQFNGRPSMMYLNLGSCTGYTQVQSVYLTGFDATNPELAEISELLKGGVVL